MKSAQPKGGESKLSPELEQAVREANQALLEFYVSEEERDEDGQAVAEDNVVPILRSLVLRATREAAKRIAEIAGGHSGPGNTVDQCRGYSAACREIRWTVRKEFGLDD